MKKLNIGDVVTNRIPLLGCKPGTRGVVYDVYEDFDDPTQQGVSIIFENGKYDGFSYEDQQFMLNEEPVFPYQKQYYKFTNVIKLYQDFKNGYWDEVLK